MRELQPSRVLRGTILVLVGSSSACAGDPGLVHRAHAFAEAHNSYRVEELLSSVTGDVAIEVPNVLPIEGKRAFADWIRWDSVTATQWQVTALRVVDDSIVEGRLTEVSTWLQVIGVGLLEFETVRLVFRDALVSAIIVGTPALEDRERLDRALAGIEAWAQHEFPERLARIRSNGRFVPEPRRAADWIALVREWTLGKR
jgi:hypothetical protein